MDSFDFERVDPGNEEGAARLDSAPSKDDHGTKDKYGSNAGLNQAPHPLPGTSYADRLTLLANGWEPISVFGKRPDQPGWQSGPITPERIATYTGTGTGLRTGRLAAFDIDLTDPDHVAATLDVLTRELGASPCVRVGRKGAMVLYRNPTPCRKIVIETGGDGQKVEILGAGQQFVAYGVHPDTGRPYEWAGHGLSMFGEEPLSTPLDSLPLADTNMIQAAAEAIRAKLVELGYAGAHIAGYREDGETVASVAAGEPILGDTLRAAVLAIPADVGRDDWITVGMALKVANVFKANGDGTYSPYGDFDGFGIFHEWSAKASGEVNDKGEPIYPGEDGVRAQWDSFAGDFKPGVHRGVGSLVRLAQVHGWTGNPNLPPNLAEEFAGAIAESKAKAAQQGEAAPGAPASYLLTDKGAPIKCLANAYVAIHLHNLQPALDLLSGREKFLGDLPWNPEEHGQQVSERVLHILRGHILSHGGPELTTELLRSAITALASKRCFHPIRDYLDGLEWDGVPRVGSWLVDLCGAEDNALNRGISKLSLIGAVARAFQPGTKYDYLVILEGGQGIEKSTFLRRLAVRNEWFVDGVPLPKSASAETVETVTATAGKWIGEIPEVDRIPQAILTNVLTGFLSKTSDTVRLKYRPDAEDYPRQFVLFGTANTDGYLGDATGNRRYLPVKVTRMDIDRLQQERDQLWAEAVALYRARECHHHDGISLPRELWDAAKEQQLLRTAVDPWEDTIAAHLEGGTSPRIKVHTAELFTLLNIPQERRTKSDARRLKVIMVQRFGWTYRDQIRVEGANRPGYIRPGSSEDADAGPAKSDTYGFPLDGDPLTSLHTTH